MIYLKTLTLFAPFDNEVVQTLAVHWNYWKTYGFEIISQPTNPLNDSLGT